MLLAIVAAVLTSTIAAAQTAPDRAAELRRLTEQRYEANAANDRAFYERLIAEHALILLPGRPPLTKKEYLDEEFLHRPASYRGSKASLEDFRALFEVSRSPHRDHV